MVFPFSKRVIKGIRFKIQSNALLSLSDKVQGSKLGDDFLFKVGLITAGNSTLSFFQKAMAPNWVVQLDQLSKGQGVDKIIFYNVVQQASLLGSRRVHPLSDLMIENMQWVYDHAHKHRTYEVLFSKPISAIGAWISPDGDQTQSTFELVIEQLELIE